MTVSGQSEPADGGATQHASMSAMEGDSESPPAGSTDFGQDIMNSIQSISQPVEMTDLSNTSSKPPPISAEQGTSSVGKAITTTSEPFKPATAQPSLLPPTSDFVPTESAIGPATDKSPMQPSSSSNGTQLVITLLLHSTETRHPYIIDEAYLKRRNVSVSENNPVNLSVYTLKELILRDWRQEWESRPASPTSIRLIHMGRLLDDKAYLKDSRFSLSDTPHIVHMTIKPQEIVDEEDARIAKGGGRDRDGNERSPGCRCVLM